jgi:hypothetical protein
MPGRYDQIQFWVQRLEQLDMKQLAALVSGSIQSLAAAGEPANELLVE